MTHLIAFPFLYHCCTLVSGCGIVFVPQGCHNKLPQVGLLKTNLFSHNSRHQKFQIKLLEEWLFLEALREDPFYASALLPSGGCWQPLHSFVCDSITSVSASIFMWPSFLCVCVLNLPLLSLTRVSVIWFRDHSKSSIISRSFIYLHLQRPCFQKRSHSYRYQKLGLEHHLFNLL